MPTRRPAPVPDAAGQRHEIALGPDRATTATLYRAARPRGALLVLAHGAGAGQHHPFMTAVASKLAGRGVDVITFDFAYIHDGRKVPDRAPVLEACFASVIDWSVQREGFESRRLFIGGKSMGGRMATHLAAAGFVARDGSGPAVSGVVALGYPLHPPGRPDKPRTAHLSAIARPVLIVQGSRDTFGTPAELRPIIADMPAPVTLHVVEGGDHSLAVSRTSRDAVLDHVADVIVEWSDSANL